MSPKNSPRILSGTAVRDARLPILIEKFKSITPAPELAIIQVGERHDSSAFIRAKIAFAEKVGVITKHIHLSQEIGQQELIQEIKKCNLNPSVKGIIVQLPLPAHIDSDEVIDTIDPHKDIDGLTTVNVKLLSENNKDAIVPATARGVKELLSHYNINIAGKKITVVGRSRLVGKPMAQLFSNEGAQVTVAHSQTTDLIQETKDADIIVVAVGKPKLIRAQHVRSGQIIIDVGINRDGEVVVGGSPAKLVGDVDFGTVSDVIGPDGAITPVPGGVGPMTVLCLFENLADACV